jgi:hypothetical protein
MDYGPKRRDAGDLAQLAGLTGFLTIGGDESAGCGRPVAPVGRSASTPRLSLRTCSRFLELRRVIISVSDSPPKTTREKFNHEIAAERYSRTVSKRQRVRTSLPAKRSRTTPGKWRKLGRKLTPRKDKSHCNIIYLYSGWGARIRTWEWRNQNQLGNPIKSTRIRKKAPRTWPRRINDIAVVSECPGLVSRRPGPCPTSASSRYRTTASLSAKAAGGPQGSSQSGLEERRGATIGWQVE